MRLQAEKIRSKQSSLDKNVSGELNAHPLVSVIIPSLNQVQFIEQTIQSVLTQSYRPLEIIIIDAVSTDETIKLLHKYDHVPEVKWTSEPDWGHADGINKGFARASGEIAAWLNSDDAYFSQDVIDTVVEVFSEKQQIDIIYGDVAVISQDNTLLRLFLLPPYSKQRLLRGNFISQPAVFMRKYVTENEKLDNDQVGLDYEYWLRLIAKGFRFSHINKLLACDRHYPERVSVTQKPLIETQIALIKIKMGLSQTHAKLMYPIDRLFQAVCRVKGLVLLLLLSLFHNKHNIVFPIKIDSYPKLFWRQLTKAIGSDFKI
jgi:glycosyltransferase involved in cell wall biosynthesis